MHLKEGEQHVDDVSSALKRFLRDLPDGLFTRAQRLAWLEASGELQPCPTLSPYISEFPPGPHRAPGLGVASADGLQPHFLLLSLHRDRPLRDG